MFCDYFTMANVSLIIDFVGHFPDIRPKGGGAAPDIVMS